MKKSKVNNQTIVQTLSPLMPFVIKEGQTNGGKKCLIIVTDKRLSNVERPSLTKPGTTTTDFKEFMHNVRVAEGFGFIKYYPELNARYVSVTGLDASTLNALALQYTWINAPVKEAKGKAAKVATKKPDESHNTQNSQTENTFTPEQIVEAIQMLKRYQRG